MIDFVDVEPQDSVAAADGLRASAGEVAAVGDPTIVATVDIVGLAALHAAGLHHGPITPEQVILDTSPTTPTPRLTNTVLGSVSVLPPHATTYAAPEQLDGAGSDAATDAYSLGVLLYEMTVGRAPFPNWDESVVAERKLRELPAPPSAAAALVPPAFDELVLGLLAPQPPRRPTATEAAEVLRRLEVPVLPSRVVPLTMHEEATTTLQERRRPLAPILGAGVAITVSSGPVAAPPLPPVVVTPSTTSSSTTTTSTTTTTVPTPPTS